MLRVSNFEFLDYMRYTIYSLIIFLAFGGIFYYLLDTLSPWNEDAVNFTVERFGLLTGAEFSEFVNEGVETGTVFGLLDLKNVAALGIVGLITVTSGFSTLHTFVDKLFFRKFYERASIFNAVRRGVLLGILVAALIILRLNGSLDPYIMAGIVVFVVLVEVLVMSFGRRSKLSPGLDPGESGGKQLKTVENNGKQSKTIVKRDKN